MPPYSTTVYRYVPFYTTNTSTTLGYNFSAAHFSDSIASLSDSVCESEKEDLFEETNEIDKYLQSFKKKEVDVYDTQGSLEVL